MSKSDDFVLVGSTGIDLTVSGEPTRDYNSKAEHVRDIRNMPKKCNLGGNLPDI